MQLPDPETRRHAFRWLGAMFVLLGVFKFFNPTTARPTGRWSWFLGFIWDVGGNSGLTMYWIAIGLVFLVFSFDMGGK